MAEKSTPNTTMEEFERLLEDKDFRELFSLSRHETPGTHIKQSYEDMIVLFNFFFLFVGSASEIASSAITTPDPLNMAFINVNIIYLLRNNK